MPEKVKKMPEKVKINGNTEEEDVKQIAQAIGKVLNRGVSVKRGENGYKDRYVLYLEDPDDPLAHLFPKKDETTGDPYYEMLLFFDVLQVYTGGYNPSKLMPKDPALQFLTLNELMPAIVGEMKEYLKGFEITHSEVGAISFVLDLKKQSSA